MSNDIWLQGSSPPVSNSAPIARSSTLKRGGGGEGGGGGGTGAGGRSGDDSRKVVTEEEQQLIEMGFTNTALNSLLLSRHNHDMDKVVAALVDY